MISQGKQWDKDTRILLMEHMAVNMRMYARTGKKDYLNTARVLGEQAKRLSERIKSHDYSKEDSEWRRVGEMDKAARDLWAKLSL